MALMVTRMFGRVRWNKAIAGGRSNLNRTDGRYPHVLDEAVDAVDAVEDPLEFGQQARGFGSRLQPSLATDEDREAGAAGAFPQHHAHGRLRYAKRHCGSGDGAGEADGMQDLELPKGQRHKVRDIRSNYERLTAAILNLFTRSAKLPQDVPGTGHVMKARRPGVLTQHRGGT
jgi:hypothetical protein